jgi:acyl-CoA synthetase (AMP-forming)/AMP-acid ligase II
MALFSAASQEILRPTIDPTANYPKGSMANTPQLGNLTIRSLLESGARNHPDRTFVLFPETGNQCTWEEMASTARSTATRLTALGLVPGETVGILAPNSKTTLELFLGSMFGGFITTVFNPLAGQTQLDYVVNHSEVRVLFVSKDNLELGQNTVNACSRTVTLIPNDPPEWPVEASEQALHMPHANDNALLIYTSGTTGLPKGVLHSHASLLAGGLNTANAHQLTEDDRALCVLSLCHINGQVVTVMAPLVSGSSVVMPSRFSASKFWETIADYKCTWFSAVPTIFSYLVQSKEKLVPPNNEFSQLRFGRSASAPLPPALLESFMTRFQIPIVETMGITETAAQILSNPLDPAQQQVGSPGIPWGNDVRIANELGTTLSTGHEGEIQVQGPNVMKGYLKNEAATQESFTSDNWYRTGDLGWMNEDGYFFVTGRRKELINKGGENISPREIDDVLYSHPAVLEAAAVAVPDSHYGQEIAACVVTKPGESVTVDELHAFCVARLGNYKSPEKIQLLEELPKGPSGKIQRLQLVQHFAPIDSKSMSS